jgi:hypothetical protein
VKAQVATQLPPEYHPHWPGMDEWQLSQKGWSPQDYRRFEFLGYDSDGAAHFAVKEIPCPMCRGNGIGCYDCDGKGWLLCSTH